MSPPPEPTPARELRFAPADMDAFAAASGDHSPLHTDAEFGRRTAFGAPIVYGGLETIALLGLLAVEDQARLRTVRSVFPGPVLIGEPCRGRVRAAPGGSGDYELTLHGRGRVLARVSAHTSPPAAASVTEREREIEPGQLGDVDSVVPRPGFTAQGPYRPGPELRALAARLGAVAVPDALLAGIAWASHAVGAGIPGFDGLCAGVTVQRAEGSGEAASQWLRVLEHDARSDRVLIDGGVRDGDGTVVAGGRVECFPFSPTHLAAPLAPSAPAPESSRGRVVVVGASRGLGAAMTLALLARGYEVDGIYSASAGAVSQLLALADEHALVLRMHRIDAADRRAVSQVAAGLAGPLEGLVLCAAPAALPMTLTPDSVEALNAHVQATLALAAVPVAAFGPLLRRDGAWLVGVSAAAVQTPVRELPQLSAAKAALEGLLRAVAPTLPGTAVVIARVPAMATDRANTPGARRRAAVPEVIAHELAALVSEGEPEPGVTVLTPGAVAVSP